MNAPQARTVANLVLATAGVAAAYVVITTPPLRRLAMRASRAWLGGSLAMFVATELGRAWGESRNDHTLT